MGKLIGTTFSIIDHRVGKGGVTSGKEVKRVNQLLRMAGYLKSDRAHDSTWSNASGKALSAFYSSCSYSPVVKEYIDPTDYQDSLGTLALAAGVLVPLPTGLRSASAATKLFDTCVSQKYPYGWMNHGGGTHVIWGFANRPEYAISTTLDRNFSESDPVSFNCTSFANLMIAVWMQGNAASSPYDASQMVGGNDPLGLRYNMQPVNGKGIENGFCHNVDYIKEIAQNDRLYNFAICNKDGFITHDTVLLNGYVYECNLDKTPAIYKTSVEDRFKRLKRKGSHVRLMGPSSF